MPDAPTLGDLLTIPLPRLIDLLEEMGEENRQLGRDVRAEHILDMMERTASMGGEAEHIFDERHRLTVEGAMSTLYIYADHGLGGWLRITRDRALQLLAERRQHD